jgi:predicted HNH restriction endonuclease
MEKKFFIKGFNETSESPVFKDKEAYSWRDASIKAKEYFEHRGFLKKVVIFEQGQEEKIAKLVFKNVFGKIEEIDVWKLPDIKRNR